MRPRWMVTGGRGHDVYLGSGPHDGGKTLRPALIVHDDMSITRVDLPQDQRG